MNKPDPVRITIRYLGVVRLIAGRREDLLEFPEPVSIKEILNGLLDILPKEAYKEIKCQTLMLASQPDLPGTVIKLPEQQDEKITDGSCITVVTPVTGD